MAEPVATPQVSTPGLAPASITTPPADQPPAREKPFSDRFEALHKEMGGDDGDTETEAETATEALPEKPVTKAAPKPEPKPEDDPVKPSERAEFREYKRQQMAMLAKDRADIEKQRTATPEEREKAQAYDDLVAAFQNGDPDTFATKLKAKDFNELQESFIKRLADPNYKEVQELKQWKAAEEKRKQDEQKQYEQQQAQRQRAELRGKWLGDLTEKSKVSKDRLAQAMGDDPMFLSTVFEIQKAHWDDAGQKTVSLEEALDRGLPGHKTTLRDELRGLYERLGKAFGEPAALAEANGRKKPAPKTAVTPAKTTDSSGGNGKFKSQAEWRAYANKALAEAED